MLQKADEICHCERVYTKQLDQRYYHGDTLQDEKTNRHIAGCEPIGSDLRNAQHAITGGCCEVYFGAKREADRISASEQELRRLSEEQKIDPPSISPTFTGGEHQVWVTGDPVDKVFKRTLPGKFGVILDEKPMLDARLFLTKPKFFLRPALPSEYLRRWELLYQAFRLPTSYCGQSPNGKDVPSMAITQPFIAQDENDQPIIEDVEQFMEQNGFVKVPACHLADPTIATVTWFREKDRLLITDVFPRNFRKEILTGALVPIDLIVTQIPEGASKIF